MFHALHGERWRFEMHERIEHFVRADPFSNLTQSVFFAMLKRNANQRSSKAHNLHAESGFRKKLLEHPGAKSALETLDAGGVKQDFVMRFLSVMAHCECDPSIRLLPKPKPLKHAADQIQRIGEEIAVYNSHPILGLEGALGLDPNLKTLFDVLPMALTSYSDHLSLQAERLAKLGKTKPSREKLLVVHFLEYAKRLSGDEHYDEIALLLTAVGATLGRTETTEPSALRMLLTRYRSSMFNLKSKESGQNIGAYFEGNSNGSPKRLTFGQRIAKTS